MAGCLSQWCTFVADACAQYGPRDALCLAVAAEVQLGLDAGESQCLDAFRCQIVAAVPFSPPEYLTVPDGAPACRRPSAQVADVGCSLGLEVTHLPGCGEGEVGHFPGPLPIGHRPPRIIGFSICRGCYLAVVGAAWDEVVYLAGSSIGWHALYDGVGEVHVLAPCDLLSAGDGVPCPEDLDGQGPVATLRRTLVVGAHLAGVAVGILEVVYETTHPAVLQVVVHAERACHGWMETPHDAGLQAASRRVAIDAYPGAGKAIGIGGAALYLELSAAGPRYHLFVERVFRQRHSSAVAVAAYCCAHVHPVVGTLYQPVPVLADQLEVRRGLQFVERHSLQSLPVGIVGIALQHIAGEADILDVVVALVERIAVERVVGTDDAVDGFVELLQCGVLVQCLCLSHGVAHGFDAAQRVAAGVGAYGIAGGQLRRVFAEHLL